MSSESQSLSTGPALHAAAATRYSPRVVWLVLGLIVVVFVTLCILHLNRCLDDDAFISFRYARNLLRGEGLVYNPGERVEGYTNFLWVILTAGAMAAGWAPAMAAQWMGILFSAAALVLLFWWSWRRRRSAWALAAPAALVALLPFTVETLLGLEMPLFVFLLLAGAVLYDREGAPRRGIATGAVFALAAMTRPEGMMVFGLTFVADGVRALAARPRRDAIPWAAWGARLGAFAVLFGPYFAWRFSYYGALLPNTFYAKTGGGLFVWGLGLSYLGRALLHLGPIALMGMVLAWRRKENRPGSLYVAAVVVCYLAYLVTVGGDFRHHFRFLVPVFPFLLMLSAEGARRMWTALPSRVSLRGVVALLLVGLVAFAAVRMAAPALRWVRYREIRNPQLFAVGSYFGRRGPPGAILAISGAGIVPYVSDLPAIGMWGLTDAHIARTPVRRVGRGVPGHLKGDGAYILSRRPHFIVFIATLWTRRPPTLREVGRNIAAISELDLWRSPRFRREYRLRSAPLPSGGFANYFERLPAKALGRVPDEGSPSPKR